MNQAPSATARHIVASGIAVIVLAASLAGCGSSATPVPSAAPTPSPTTAATPSPTVAPSPTPTPSPTPISSPSAVAVDPTEGLTIGAPYSLTPLPAALQQAMETQIASGLGAFGGAFQIGFKQVNGGTAFSILMVMAFPPGLLNDTSYPSVLASMSTSMKVTFKTSTVDGVQVSNGVASTGGVAMFHIGDHMLVVIAQATAESLPVATALIKANK